MLSTDVTQYLQHCKAQNAPLPRVLDELTQQGLTPDQLAEAQQWYQGQTSPQPSGVYPPSGPPLGKGGTNTSSPQHVSPTSPSPLSQSSPPQGKPVAKDTLAPIPTALEQVFDQEEKRRFPLVIFVIVILVVFGGLFLGIAAPLGIAYGYIPVGDERVQVYIEEQVMKLPFMPKTPGYVARQVLQNYANVDELAVETDLTLSLDSLSAVLGEPTASGTISGGYQRDEDSPARSTWTISRSPDLDVTFLHDAAASYARVAAVPAAALSLLSLEPRQAEPFLNQWVGYGSADPAGTTEAPPPDSDELVAQERTRRSQLLTFLKNQIFPAATISGEETEAGTGYTFRVSLSDDQTKLLSQLLFDISWEIAPEAGSDDRPQDMLQVDESNIEIRIAPDTYLIEEISYGIKGVIQVPSSVIAPPPTMSFIEVPSLANERFTLSGIVNLKKDPEDMTFPQTENPVPFSVYLDELSKVIVSSEAFESSNANQLKGSDVYRELESLLRLETAVLHYYYDTDTMPGQPDDVLESDDYFDPSARKKVKQDLDDENILFVRSGDGKSIFIVTTEKDEENEGKPYRGIILYNGESSKLQNFSAGEVNELNESFEILGSNG